jgi:hypothetical protein
MRSASTTETQDQVKGRFLLNVVVGEGSSVFELLSGEAVREKRTTVNHTVPTMLHQWPGYSHQPLLVWRDPLLVLNLSLDVIDRVRRLHLKGDRLSSQGLDEDLHTTTETEHQVKGRFLLDVVVGEGSSVFELLSGETIRDDRTTVNHAAPGHMLESDYSHQPLLVWRDSLLVLNLSLDVIDRVRRLDLEGDSLSGQGLDEDLHTTTETEDQVEGGLLLDVVVRKGSSVFELLSGKAVQRRVHGDNQSTPALSRSGRDLKGMGGRT